MDKQRVQAKKAAAPFFRAGARAAAERYSFRNPAASGENGKNYALSGYDMCIKLHLEYHYAGKM